MNHEDDDSDVVAAVEREEQFRKKAPEYLNMLFAIIFSITIDRELSNEIVQQTFVKYLDRMEEANWNLEIRNEGAYLVGMAKNLLRDFWRERGKREFTSLDDQIDHQLLNDLSQLTDTFDVQKKMYFEDLFRTLPLKTLLGRLKDDQKKLMELYFDQDMSPEEIAEELNVDVIVVKYKLSAICSTIRARLRKICGKTGLFKSDS
jgi:RNA polymerase sigma factor (sigma-70 family)